MSSSTSRQAVVIGSGIAGLSTALHLGHCTLMTKTTLGAGSTRWAQGGLAAAIGPDDSSSRHVADTLRVSGGLADPDMAQLVIEAAPAGIEWLTSNGSRFDRADGTLLLGREAGHSADRIVHAHGDATGLEIVRSLTEAVRQRPDIEVLDNTTALDLVVADSRVVGLSTLGPDGGIETIPTASVVLATGGIGRVYSSTTNPVEATGDGLAMAWRAGAAVRDCEFVQFHPTALAAGLDPLPLLTEAFRGAGGVLVDDRGHRFMTTVHDDAELAPRDIVARAIWQQLRDGEVLLDVRSVDHVVDRFPTAVENARSAGLDIESDLLPVTPAQHFFMGGVVVDEHGCSTIPGLYAAGEVSATGLHGANRLASNSLIEGLTFGRIIAESIRKGSGRHGRSMVPEVVDEPGIPLRQVAGDPVPEGIDELRRTMWVDAGIVRSGSSLARAAEKIDELRPELEGHIMSRNLVTTAALVVESALGRAESRGAHYRSDFPTTEPALDRSVVRRLSDRAATVRV